MCIRDSINTTTEEWLIGWKQGAVTFGDIEFLQLPISTSINEISKENTIQFYPNPAADFLYFKSEKYISLPVTLTIKVLRQLP